MKYRIFILTILASVGFFNYRDHFGEQPQKAMFYLMFLISAVYVIKNDRSLKGIRFPWIAYALLLLCFLVTAVVSTAFHTQSFFVSFIAVFPYLFAYAYLFLMLKFDFDTERLMRVIIGLCVASSVIYFINAATVPFNIFGKPLIGIDETRGIVRLPVVFIMWFPMLVFYGISKWNQTKQIKWMALIAFASLMIVLSVVRQVIALTAVLGCMYFFREISWFKKILFIAAICGTVVFVLPKIPVYKAMIELSEDQKDENDDDENIRIKAWRYYTYENQTNGLSPFVGNGMPSYGKSLWGKIVENDNNYNGLYCEDVGWAGFFWYFGGIATLCLMVLMASAFFRKKPQGMEYINYWIAYIFITSVASAPILYMREVLCVVTGLSIAFKCSGQSAPASLPDADTRAEETDSEACQNLLPRHPQL